MGQASFVTAAHLRAWRPLRGARVACATVERGLDRRQLLRLIAVLSTLVAASGAIVFATRGGDGQPSEPRHADGYITAVAPGSFVLQPVDGGAPQRFAVRPVDAERIDVPHLEQHRLDQIPVRVFHAGGGRSAYATDVADR
jgi:hypothetical protein